VIEKLRESRGWQFLLIAALILVVPLIADVNRRMGDIRRMHQKEAELEQELTAVQAEQEALQEELEYVNSDAYVEEWARVEARMTLTDEVAIVPVITEPPQQTESAESPSPPGDTSSSIPKEWHSLFFDDATAP